MLNPDYIAAGPQLYNSYKVSYFKLKSNSPKYNLFIALHIIVYYSNNSYGR